MTKLGEAASAHASEAMERVKDSFERDTQLQLVRALLELAFCAGALHGGFSMSDKISEGLRKGVK